MPQPGGRGHRLRLDRRRIVATTGRWYGDRRSTLFRACARHDATRMAGEASRGAGLGRGCRQQQFAGISTVNGLVRIEESAVAESVVDQADSPAKAIWLGRRRQLPNEQDDSAGYPR